MNTLAKLASARVRSRISELMTPGPEMIRRRQALRDGALGLLAFSVPSLVARNRSAAGAGAFEPWLARVAKFSRDLGAGRISQAEWRSGMADLYAKVPLAQLLTAIDFDRVKPDMMTRDLGTRGEVFDPLAGGTKQRTKLSVADEPARMLISKVAHVRKGRSIPPHGHRNMVSAFLVISGDFRVRQYDKVAEERESLIIRPTIDEVAGVGSWSDVSDQRNNIHWLTAMSDDSFLFTAKVVRVDRRKRFEGRVNIDAGRAREIAGGTLRARKISYAESCERY